MDAQGGVQQDGSPGFVPDSSSQAAIADAVMDVIMEVFKLCKDRRVYVGKFFKNQKERGDKKTMSMRIAVVTKWSNTQPM